MSATVSAPSLAVLRNRGIPVRVHVLDEDKARTFDAADEPVTTVLFVRFTNNVLADLCEPENFGSLDGWEEAIEENPALTIPRTLALCWDVDRRVAGDMMLDNCLDDYATVVGVAFALANGVDPDTAGKLLAAGVAAVGQKAAALKKEMESELAKLTPEPSPNNEPPPADDVPAVTTPIVQQQPEVASTSPDYGDVGSAPVEALASSGT